MTHDEAREAVEVAGTRAVDLEHAPASAVNAAANAALYEVLDATRALLWLTGPADAACAAQDLVTALGGRVMPGAAVEDDSLLIDLSFGAGEPRVPAAAPDGAAQALLRRHLPMFVRDAARALELAESSSRLAEDASIDPLTRLANRRQLTRALDRLSPDSTVVMIDLDDFKGVNDNAGHEEGDQVLRIFGSILAATVRGSEIVGRYGGDEFVIVLDTDDASPFLDRLRFEWELCRPHPVSFSAGIASSRPNPHAAVRAADRAMYRAKQQGRNRWQCASPDDYL
jgi:diguanylate cyclase (GGDEF)-like protein